MPTEIERFMANTHREEDNRLNVRAAGSAVSVAMREIQRCASRSCITNELLRRYGVTFIGRSAEHLSIITMASVVLGRNHNLMHDCIKGRINKE